jgi:ATP-dependent DNA helicase PIF1
MALKAFHPDYQDIVICQESLDSLPEDGSVFDQLPSVIEDTTHTDRPHGPPAQPIPDEPDNGPGELTEGMIPNLGEGVNIAEESRAALQQVAPPSIHLPPVLTAPLVQASPINEHDPTNQFLRCAFPFLFPSGEADLRADRAQTVRESDYFEHLMRYKDGRFAQHPRFR